MDEFDALKAAVAAGSGSPCAKSKRGVVVWCRDERLLLSEGRNAPPPPFRCTGTQACRDACGKVCVHAEQEALLRTDPLMVLGAEMLHVKVVDGEPVPSGPPSCVDCSKLILRAGLAAMWLLEERGGAPTLVRYTAREFHAATLRHLGLPGGEMHRPFIVAVCGKKRHGKDTVGRFLRSTGFQSIAFADPIKRIAMDIYGLSYEQVYGDDLKEVVDERWGRSPRDILQRIGTEMGRNIHVDTWVRRTITTIRDAYDGKVVEIHRPEKQRFETFQFKPGLSGGAARWAVTDCRFPSEAEAVRAAGGVVLKVVRPSLGESGDTHPSETSVDLVEPDHLIVNDGSLELLESRVREFLATVFPAPLEL